MQTNQVRPPPNSNPAHVAQKKHPDVTRQGHPSKQAQNPPNGLQPPLTVLNRYCRLIKVTNHTYENLDRENKIYQFEEAFDSFSNRCPNNTDEEVERLLMTEKGSHPMISKAAMFAFLANTPETGKYLKYLRISSEIDQWIETLTSMNKLILDAFCCIKQQVRLKMVHLLEFLISMNPTNVDNIITNFVREMNSGSFLGPFNEVVELLTALAEMIIRKKDWFSKYLLGNGSALFPCIFATFTRLLSDLPPGNDKCRQLLVYVIDFIVKERFKDLLPMGRDLILCLQRVSRIFPGYWKALTHKPQELLLGFEGIPQLLSSRCSQNFNNCRIAFKLQFYLDHIFLYRPETTFVYHLEWLATDCMSGFDSCSLRTEMIRFVINNTKYQTVTEHHIKNCRNAFLVFIVNNAAKKNIVPDCQMAKLALIFDCFGKDKDASHGSVLEAFFMAIRYFLDKQPDIGNSLLDLLIRTTLEFHPKFSIQLYSNLVSSFRLLLSFGTGVQTLVENRQISQTIRLSLSELLPEVYGKQTSDPNASGSSNKFEDLAAESRLILEQASGSPKVLQPNRAEKNKLKASRSSDQELNQVRKGILIEKTRQEAKSLDELLPTIHEKFRDAVEKFKLAVEQASTDDKIDPCDEARNLFTLAKDNPNIVNKEQAKILAACVIGICSRYLNGKQFYVDPGEAGGIDKNIVSGQINKPIFIIFDCITKTKNQKPNDKKVYLQILRQMAKLNNSIGYLFLYYLTSTPGKHSKMEVFYYYEFAGIMKSENKERLCEDMTACSIDCTSLFSYLLPYIFSSFSEAPGSTSLIETICVTLDEHQAYSLASYMYSRGDISLFRKDTFSELFHMSLQWNTHAQNIFWQLVRVDTVSVDWIFDAMAIIKESKHPIVCFNILNMVQYMEIEIKASISRGLFVKNSEDSLTMNLLNLILVDADTQNQLAQRLVTILKGFMTNKKYYRVDPTQTKTVSPEKHAVTTYSNLQTVFEHLEKIIHTSKPSKKEENFVRSFVRTKPLLTFYKDFKQNDEIFEEMQNKFGDLFAEWRQFAESEGTRPNNKGKGRKLQDTSGQKEGGRTTKKPKISYEIEDSDD